MLKIKHFAICFLLFALCAESAQSAVSCNVPNLIQCLDSACAININTHPGARCALCGTDLAADAVKQKSNYTFGGADVAPQMQQLALGRVAAITFSERDLRNAPSEAGKRYAWASAECRKKVPNCTAEDIEKNYDKLIEQSCRAVLSDNEYAAAHIRPAAKSRAACNAEMQNYMTGNSRCGVNFINCVEDPDFDRYFSSGIVDTKCDDFASALRVDMLATRDGFVRARADSLDRIVTAHRESREARVNAVRAGCRDGSLKAACVATACNVMPNNCPEVNGGGEVSSATLLCKYVELACDRVK
ncbi:MAG: hypothetical protein FWG18_01485 [Alphaproteobacteria bacterium]|nr:hypothetical protein [Alphaproteobacteria bacterium]